MESKVLDIQTEREKTTAKDLEGGKDRGGIA